jgi:hypothetical protein
MGKSHGANLRFSVGREGESGEGEKEESANES